MITQDPTQALQCQEGAQKVLQILPYALYFHPDIYQSSSASVHFIYEGSMETFD